ncbi:MAG: DUF5110 domain-containing protein, partial [Thermoanaerobaculia bacterium]
FDYRRGVFARRRFASRTDATGTVIEIGAPEGTYRPRARAMVLNVRSPMNRTVSMNGIALSQVSDLAKADRGWTSKDGVVMIKFPDQLERVEIRISN